MTAAASGAVMHDENPAAKSPHAKSGPAPVPRRAASIADTPAYENGPSIPAPATRMAMEMTPPSGTATASPKRMSRSCCPRAIPEPRKRL